MSYNIKSYGIGILFFKPAEIDHDFGHNLSLLVLYRFIIIKYQIGGSSETILRLCSSQNKVVNYHLSD